MLDDHHAMIVSIHDIILSFAEWVFRKILVQERAS